MSESLPLLAAETQDSAEVAPESQEVVETEKIQEEVVEHDSEVLKDEKSLRTITVQNLRHPGGYLTSRQFQSVLNKSISFTSTFSRPEDSDDRQLKNGSIEMIFATHGAARDAYTMIQKMIIDGYRPEALVDSRFFSIEPPTPTHRHFFETTESDPRIVFLLDAPKSVDEHMLAHFFQGDYPVHFQTLPMANGNGLLQVEVLMGSPEAAGKILAGESKFQISDEEVDCVVTLLSPREYTLYSKMDDIHVRPATATSRPTAPAAVPSTTQLAPEIDEDVVLRRLLTIIDDEKVNFAELEEHDAKHELYRLCDRVSEEYDGVPDSILKPAMGTALQRHLNQTELHWMRHQIEGLLKMWKAEMMSEEVFQRETAVAMKAPNYEPVFEERKEAVSKGAIKRQKAARAQMGVGAFLTAHRDRLIVETGDVDMESDDDGNVMIGGEALSFDSWARITKTKANGVVRANDDGTKKIGNGGLTKKQMRQARLVEGMSQEEWKQWRKEKSTARKADIKQRIMARGAMIEGEEPAGVEEDVVASEDPTSSVPEVPVVPKKDLDEGEIDSDEERKEQLTKKKRKASSDSSDSSSSSSSSEDDPDGPVNARKKRNMRRKKERKMPRVASANTITPQVNLEFRQMFENRKAIIAQMTPAHKAAFASALNQITQNAGGTTQAKASQVITSMMSGFK